MIKINETKNPYKIYIDNNGPFIAEAVAFDNRVKEIALEELRDIIEDYGKEFYDKYGCQPVSQELQTKFKSEISNILNKYTVDSVLITVWEVDIIPVMNGFKIEITGYSGTLNWGFASKISGIFESVRE